MGHGTWHERCPDGKPCGRTDCPRCSPSAILPASQRGSKKERRNTPMASSKYLILKVGYGTTPTARVPGTDEYLTPDGAVHAAKKLKRSCIIVRGHEIIADVSDRGTVTFR